MEDGTTFRFDHGDLSLVVEDHTAAQVGAIRSFLVVHGIGMGRSVFAELVDLLLPHGRVVTVDLPGYGEAPEPARVPSIEQTADALAALLADLNLVDLTLIGHSMGSQVVAEVAARHPGLAVRIVLAAPTVDVRGRHAMVQLFQLGRDLFGESPLVLLRGSREYLRAGPHLRGKLRATLRHRPELAYPRITVPTLVLRGATDKVSSREWCRTVTRLVPQAQLAELDGHGHETMIRDAEPAARLLCAFATGGTASG